MIYVANFAIGFFAGIPYVNVGKMAYQYRCSRAKTGVQFEYISRAGVYISEVAHKSKRSQFGALQAVFLVIGIIAAQGRNSELFKIFSWDFSGLVDFFVFSPIFENGALSS